MSDHTDTTLTDTERAELAPFQWAFHIGVAEGRSYEAAKALTAVVESIVAARVAAARAEQDALWRERLTELPDQMSGAWGGGAPWLTTGDKVATLVGDWLRALIEGADQ